jgi:hypothetical protein
VADLTWSGTDGFDSRGRRVAAVGRGFDTTVGVVGVGHSGSSAWAMRSYWEAFVAQDGRFDFVLVDGERGRWATSHEAKAAAEAAYRPLAMEPSSGSTSSAGEAVDGQDRNQTGVLAQLRNALPAWLTVYWSDRQRRSP